MLELGIWIARGGKFPLVLSKGEGQHLQGLKLQLPIMYEVFDWKRSCQNQVSDIE